MLDGIQKVGRMRKRWYLEGRPKVRALVENNVVVQYIFGSVLAVMMLVLRLFGAPGTVDPPGRLRDPSRALAGGTSTYNYVFIGTSGRCL